MKKVYFLIRSIGVGGAERQLCLLASELQKNGYQTKIITIYDSGSSEAEPESTDISITSLGRRNRWDLSFFIKLFVLIKKEKPDIVHSYLQIANIATAFVKILFPRIKVVWGIRASYVDTSQYDCVVQITQKVHDHLNKIPDYIIFNSHAGMKHAARLGYPKEKSCVIQNGIDTKRFFPDREAGLKLRQNWRVEANLKLIGMVARIDPQKDYPNFLNAAALLVKERSDVRFVCVGDGPERLKREYWRLSHRLGLDNVLIWAGEQKDMLSVYNALDILVLSSYGEGFPNVIGEAMACGVPCVATNVGDVAQLIGHLGKIVPAKDSEALKQGIIALLDQLEHKEIDLRAQTRQRILEQFSVTNLVVQTMNIFEQVLSKEP